MGDKMEARKMYSLNVLCTTWRKKVKIGVKIHCWNWWYWSTYYGYLMDWADGEMKTS